MKKLILGLLIICTLFLSGCKDDTQIDKASIAEAVFVSEADKGYNYTFVMLESEDNVKSNTINADSLSSACESARKSDIPNLTLSKLEVVLFEENTIDKLYKDVKYLSENAEFSPLIKISLCDDKTIDYAKKEKDATESIKDLIILEEKNNSNLSGNSLLIINSIQRENSDKIYIPCINSDKELKITSKEIKSEKWKNSLNF